MTTDEMKQDENKKPSRRRYIIAAVIFLMIIAALFVSFLKWELKPDQISEKTIREITAVQLNKDPNELVCYEHEKQADYPRDVNDGTENQSTQFYPFSPKVTYNIGAYYYPWYFNDFHGGQYFREHLVPPQEPVLGEYNDRNEDVITQHLAWSKYAGINFWITSWWGPGSREDFTILNHILQHPDLGDFKIAVFYETEGRTSGFSDYSNLGSDITYLAEHYFSHPNYLKIEGKPVLFIYLTRVLSARGTLQKSLNEIRNAAANANYSLYIVGDHVFGPPPNLPGNMTLLDGVTNYDVYGSMGAAGYATQTKVDLYYANQASWKLLADSVGVTFIPAVTPGFNDMAVRNGHAPLSRKLEADKEFGSLFRAMIQKARNLTDSSVGRIIMVTSWNEWHEDTQIEPVKLAPTTNVDDSNAGDSYTDNLSYEGYGERYLKILREEIIP